MGNPTAFNYYKKERMIPAVVEDKSKLKYPYLGYPKMNGIHVYIENAQVRTTYSNSPVNNEAIQEVFGDVRLEGCEGYLIIGEPYDPVTKIHSFMKSKVNVKKENVDFYVTDISIRCKPYYLRKQEIKRRFNLLAGLGSKDSKTPQTIIRTASCGTEHQIIFVNDAAVLSNKTLNYIQNNYVSKGYDGVILKDPHGFYKFEKTELEDNLSLLYQEPLIGEATILDVIMKHELVGQTTKRGLKNAKSTKKTANIGKGKTIKFFRVPTDKPEALQVIDSKGLKFVVKGYPKDIVENKQSYIGKTAVFKYKKGTGEKPRSAVLIDIK